MGPFARTPTTPTMNTLLALAVLGAVRTHATTSPGALGYSGVVDGVGMIGIFFFTNIKALFLLCSSFCLQGTICTRGILVVQSVLDYKLHKFFVFT